MASPEAVAVVQSLASALIALHDLQQAAAVYKLAAVRLLRTEPGEEVRNPACFSLARARACMCVRVLFTAVLAQAQRCMVKYMERFDAVHAMWEQSLMALEDPSCAWPVPRLLGFAVFHAVVLGCAAALADPMLCLLRKRTLRRQQR